MEENITIEFVRNWIEKHHLTRKSYESVLTDTLTNNGHYYIDNPYLRDWIIKNTEMFRNILPYELNENQQIVLDTLKDDSLGSSPFFTIWHTMENNQLFNGKGMTVRQQFEVLASFAEWGMENEQED
ncbi:hypothetical protein P7H46_12180 [Enterococcus pseudoavium]|uniref:Uncharacterized protein n=1 Tax=Enterococcus pseudoavium TaxID=44007 RepID=A0ABU3FKG0_9ENTE|nr:hypothetical protein [Enterococcus pseudoavium]MDT2771577.1 hypothetical protein [Enterococcus pseudoavium]